MKKDNENRKQLIALSNSLKPYVDSGMFAKMNEAIKTYYTTDDHQHFKTFWQWKAEGKKVKKGSKAFAVWGKPIQAKRGEKEKKKEKEEIDEYEYYPICFLFSNAQVE